MCKLPKVDKGSAPVFPFLYPDEYVRLMRFEDLRFEYRVLWGFILREGPRISEAARILWGHLSQLPNGRWLLNVPETKTGRALAFVLNVGTGEALEELRRRMPGSEGPFTWLTATNVKKAAADLRRHIEESGTTRERLLFNDGRLRRLREHDLRSTFVTWCKLAGIDNETIAQHTGHESSQMIARYNRSKATLEHMGLPPYLPLDQALTGGGCDAARDASPLEGCHPIPEDVQSSMITAVREPGFEPGYPVGRWNLNPTPSNRDEQSAGKTTGPPAPEGAGMSPASHPGVTLIEAYRDTLRAAAQAALAADVWSDIPDLQRMFAAASKAAGGATVLELVGRRAK
jgi:hypothetical protein